jgi:tetratricopeptide (TPR) repeat protein
MKALEKDRSRRYETANGFAMDVQRYLADEPVFACPPSAGYRLKKFARRNKGGLAVAALVLGFLVLLGSGVGWMVRDRAARQSRIEAQVDQILAEVGQLETEQKWPEALAAAQRAEALTADGADAATRERVRQVLDALQMVARLEEVRLSEAYTAGAEGRTTAHQPRLYAAAFRDFGVDVETLPAEESAARLRARPAVVIALAAALDEWARTGRKRDPDQAKRLWSLAAAIDPDPWRVSVRQASAATDVESLVTLANAPDTAGQPPQCQFLLASSLELCDQIEQAIALLERACEIHPGDFWIHYQLASLNLGARPARLDAALRHVVAARALRPRSAATWSNFAVVLLKQKKLDEAIAAARRATELGPKNAQAYSVLGWALTEQRKLDEAVAACRRAIEFDPKLANAHHNLGYALDGQRKLDEAIAAYKKAIELDPKSAMSYSNLGVALHGGQRAEVWPPVVRDQEKVDEEIAAYRKAIEIDPKLALAYRNLGATLREQKKLDEAIGCYRKAIEIDPTDIYDHARLGRILWDQRRLDEAAEVYRKALDINPKWVSFFLRLGGVLREQKKWDEAIGAYRMFIALRTTVTGWGVADPGWGSPDAGWGAIGAVFADQEKWDEAIDAYRKAVEHAPKDPQWYTKLGDALMKRGKPDEAAAAFRKVIEIQPKYYSSQSTGLLRSKKWQEAVDAANKAIELDPNDAAAWGNLGAALVQLKKWDAAIAACRKAVELDRKNANAHWGLGSALFNQKKWGEAAAAFREVTELNPKDATAHSNLGAALREQRKLDEAVAAYRKVIELDPKNSSAYFWLGKTLESQGKLDETVACFRKSVELDPNHAGAHYISLLWLLTNCREAKLRDPQEGLDVARKAVQLAPQSADAWQMLGWAHYRMGDWKACIGALEKSCALQDNPKGGDAAQWFFLAMAHWRLGEKDKAREWYDRAAAWMDKHDPNSRDLRRFRAEAAELLGLNEKK